MSKLTLETISDKVRAYLTIRCESLNSFTMKVQDQEDGRVYYTKAIRLDELKVNGNVLGILEDGTDFVWIDTACLREVDENNQIIRTITNLDQAISLGYDEYAYLMDCPYYLVNGSDKVDESSLQFNMAATHVVGCRGITCKKCWSKKFIPRGENNDSNAK